MARDVLMGDVVITRFGGSKNTMQAFLRFASGTMHVMIQAKTRKGLFISKNRI